LFVTIPCGDAVVTVHKVDPDALVTVDPPPAKVPAVVPSKLTHALAPKIGADPDGTFILAVPTVNAPVEVVVPVIVALPVTVAFPVMVVGLGSEIEDAVQLGPPVEILEASIAPVSSKAVLIPPFGICI
jgi:hypothetical protein